jgi:hypothetical protein
LGFLSKKPCVNPVNGFTGNKPIDYSYEFSFDSEDSLLIPEAQNQNTVCHYDKWFVRAQYPCGFQNPEIKSSFTIAINGFKINGYIFNYVTVYLM